MKCFINRKYLEDNRVMDALGILLGVNMTPVLDTGSVNSQISSSVDKNIEVNNAHNTKREVKQTSVNQQESKPEKTDVEMTEIQVKVAMNKYSMECSSRHGKFQGKFFRALKNKCCLHLPHYPLCIDVMRHSRCVQGLHVVERFNEGR